MPCTGPFRYRDYGSHEHEVTVAAPAHHESFSRERLKWSLLRWRSSSARASRSSAANSSSSPGIRPVSLANAPIAASCPNVSLSSLTASRAAFFLRPLRVGRRASREDLFLGKVDRWVQGETQCQQTRASCFSTSHGAAALLWPLQAAKGLFMGSCL